MFLVPEEIGVPNRYVEILGYNSLFQFGCYECLDCFFNELHPKRGKKGAKDKIAVVKAEANAHLRSECIAVERVNAQFREKTVVEARDKAAATAAAKMNQQKNDNDLSKQCSKTMGKILL
ncbi:hypothetical protein Tco_0957182, partial [Tanacetum coccineum]